MIISRGAAPRSAPFPGALRPQARGTRCSHAWLALLLGTVLGGIGCSTAAPPDMALPPPTVPVSYPVERPVEDFSSFTGRTGAVDTIQVRSRVTGYLDRVRFKDGDLVGENDVL